MLSLSASPNHLAVCYHSRCTADFLLPPFLHQQATTEWPQRAHFPFKTSDALYGAPDKPITKSHSARANKAELFDDKAAGDGKQNEKSKM